MRGPCTPTRQQSSLPATTEKPGQQRKPSTAKKKKTRKFKTKLTLLYCYRERGDKAAATTKFQGGWFELKLSYTVNQRVPWCMMHSHCVLSSWSSNFSSVAQSCLTLCNPMDCSAPGLPVYHQLPELAQIHVHRVAEAIQPSHPLSSNPTL